MWAQTLQPCIDEIIRIYTNDDECIAKVMQPYVLNEGINSLFDGTYTNSMLNRFVWAKSPLMRGLEEHIASMDGIQEQTPGWGTVNWQLAFLSCIGGITTTYVYHHKSKVAKLYTARLWGADGGQCDWRKSKSWNSGTFM